MDAKEIDIELKIYISFFSLVCAVFKPEAHARRRNYRKINKSVALRKCKMLVTDALEFYKAKDKDRNV